MYNLVNKLVGENNNLNVSSNVDTSLTFDDVIEEDFETVNKTESENMENVPETMDSVGPDIPLVEDEDDEDIIEVDHSKSNDMVNDANLEKKATKELEHKNGTGDANKNQAAHIPDVSDAGKQENDLNGNSRCVEKADEKINNTLTGEIKPTHSEQNSAKSAKAATVDESHLSTSLWIRNISNTIKAADLKASDSPLSMNKKTNSTAPSSSKSITTIQKPEKKERQVTSSSSKLIQPLSRTRPLITAAKESESQNRRKISSLNSRIIRPPPLSSSSRYSGAIAERTSLFPSRVRASFRTDRVSRSIPGRGTLIRRVTDTGNKLHVSTYDTSRSKRFGSPDNSHSRFQHVPSTSKRRSPRSFEHPTSTRHSSSTRRSNRSPHVSRKPSPDDKQEIIRLMRRKEEEYRIKEEELKLQREKERLKYEKEKLARERAEIQQLKLSAQLASAQLTSFMPQAQGIIPPLSSGVIQRAMPTQSVPVTSAGASKPEIISGKRKSGESSQNSSNLNSKRQRRSRSRSISRQHQSNESNSRRNLTHSQALSRNRSRSPSHRLNASMGRHTVRTHRGDSPQRTTNNKIGNASENKYNDGGHYRISEYGIFPNNPREILESSSIRSRLDDRRGVSRRSPSRHNRSQGNQINERRIDDNRRHDISEATRSYFTSSTGNRYDDRPSEYAPRTDPSYASRMLGESRLVGSLNVNEFPTYSSVLHKGPLNADTFHGTAIPNTYQQTGNSHGSYNWNSAGASGRNLTERAFGSSSSNWNNESHRQNQQNWGMVDSGSNTGQSRSYDKRSSGSVFHRRYNQM